MTCTRTVASLKEISVMPVLYQIGTQPVRISGDPPRRLRQPLQRVPVSCPAWAPVVELFFRSVSNRDWPLEIDKNETSYSKGMPSHFLRLCFQKKRIEIHFCDPIEKSSLYFIQRDIFCGLGVFSGEPLLHASAVILNGKSVVFCGESGAGKSTTAKMFQDEADVINDEVNWACSQQDGSFNLVNQRFWTDFAESHDLPQVPLLRIYLLRQATQCSLKTIVPAQIFPLLLAAPYGGQDPTLEQRSEATADLAVRIPAKQLNFNLNKNEVRNIVRDDLYRENARE